MCGRVVVALVVVVGAASVTASAQRPRAAQLLPPGFTVTIDKDFGPGYMFEGTKANEGCPRPHASFDIIARGGWTPNPLVDKTMEMIAQAPEDPPSQTGATRDEPMGKERYRNGVLTWRKATTPWIGAGKGPDKVTVSATWAAAGPGLLFGAGVSGYCGSKETVRGWVDAMIDQLAKVK